MWKSLRALMSLNDPGWGRQNSGNDDNRQQQQRPGDGPPDLDELWRDLNRRLSGLFGRRRGLPPPGTGGGGDRPPMRGAGAGLGLLAVVALLLWLGSGFYIVQEGQAAAVLRFGEFKYLREQAGFTWRMPYPLESHELVNVQQLRQIEAGYRSNVKNKVLKESLMLTLDQSIADLQFAVQFRVSDPVAYLFNNKLDPNPEELVRQAAEAALREVVGRKTIDQVLYEEKDVVAKEGLNLMQEIVDRYKTGLLIVDLTVQQAQPPEQVQAAFEDANKADQDRQRLINEGVAYANDVIPKARGGAARLGQEAEGYRSRVIAAAEGDASRFKQVLTEYARAPQVTRERMYLETMQQVFSNTSKVFVDSGSGSSNLLYLPLDRLLQQAGGNDAARAGGAPATALPESRVDPPPMTGDRRTEALRSRDREAGR